MDKSQNAASQMHEVDEDMDDRLEDMICDIGESSFMKPHIYDNLCSEKDVSLYKGVHKFYTIVVVVKIV